MYFNVVTTLILLKLILNSEISFTRLRKGQQNLKDIIFYVEITKIAEIFAKIKLATTARRVLSVFFEII